MATIDGIQFNLTNFRPVGYIKSTQSKPPGSDSNPNTDLGSGRTVISLSGLEVTRLQYDAVMAAFLSEGIHELVLDDGWKYYVQRGQRQTPRWISPEQNWFPYTITLVTEDQYIYSTTGTDFVKSITSDGQQWSADDSSNPIITAGNVAAKPTIVVTAGAAGSTFSRAGKAIDESETSEYTNSTASYVLKKTVTLPAMPGQKYHITYFAAELKCASDRVASYKMTYQFGAAAETDAGTLTRSDPTYALRSTSLNLVSSENEQVVLKFYLKTSEAGYQAYAKNTHYRVDHLRVNQVNGVQVWNTADDETVTDVCNGVNEGTVITINPDGTGTLRYSDDFSTPKWEDAYFDLDGTVVISSSNMRLFAADYIVYDIDCKYPIAGTPVLTAKMVYPAGDMSIQVALDNSGQPGTWYDIGTAAVSNVRMEYPLKASAVNFAGQTKVWFKIINASGQGDINDFQLDVDLICLDAQIPTIPVGSTASTFQCDFASGSPTACTVSIQFEDRKWS